MAVEIFKYPPFFSDANLQAYYRFEGNSNDSKNSNNGTDSNITYSIPNGKFGQGAGFNGTSSGITFGTLPNLTSNWTIGMYFNATVLGGVLYSRFASTGANRQLNIYFSGTKIQIDVPFIAAILTTTTTLSTGIWYSFFLTRSGNTWTAYLNGVSDGTTSNATGQENGGTPTIGKNSPDATNFYSGKMDEFLLFDRALSATEIANYYKFSSGGGFLLNFV